MGTKKGQTRKTARRAYMPKKKISNGKRRMRQSDTLARAARRLRIKVKRMGI